MPLQKDEFLMLENKARDLRKLLIDTVVWAGSGHVGGSLSSMDVMTLLYHKVMNINPSNPEMEDRDRFILSKGHACVALYAVLADRGFFDKKLLDNFGRKGSILGGHPDMHKVPGVEASTGALGHGFPFGVGMALAGKKDNKDYRAFTLLGDGECQEGSIWEAAMFASQQKLDNLVSIIDYNKLQALDWLDRIVGLEPLADKWRSFGWQVVEVNGHDFVELERVFKEAPVVKNKPTMVIAHTIKGKGISFMEKVPIWHFRLPNPQEAEVACRELGLDIAELR